MRGRIEQLELALVELDELLDETAPAVPERAKADQPFCARS